ncbi:MAG: hypothetical protein INQ03_00690 [Candidatus Heimdallarchaeota archaeon]|nr:hypothetical protein [Candidatus Heimdallarchaeota archaeon]
MKCCIVLLILCIPVITSAEVTDLYTETLSVTYEYNRQTELNDSIFLFVVTGLIVNDNRYEINVETSTTRLLVVEIEINTRENYSVDNGIDGANKTTHVIQSGQQKSNVTAYLILQGTYTILPDGEYIINYRIDSQSIPSIPLIMNILGGEVSINSNQTESDIIGLPVVFGMMLVALIAIMSAKTYKR